MRASNTAWSLVFAVLAGCGGATFVDNGGDGGGAGDSGGGDGGTSDSGRGACPASAPATGAACADTALACEYGTSPIVQCNQLYTCSGGRWSAPGNGSDPKFCHPSTSGCPATRGAVPVGTTCAPSGLECDYPSSRCACTTPISGPARLDAGTEWVCDSPRGDCPAPRPLVGSACTSAGKTCDYGACTLPGGVSLTCADGRWQNRPTPCPL
jgi:hypothetical protein